MAVREPAMSAEQFERAVKKLGHTVYSCADDLGISTRQAHRYADPSKKGQPVPATVAKLLQMYIKHGIPGAK